MPIKPSVISRRLGEQGRIRLGAKQGGNGRPMKLESFRFTSTRESHINDLAALYGGEARPWDNNGKAEFEVFTDANSIPVIAVKGGLSQWMETWSGGGCVHRCDGEVGADGTLCNPDDPAHKNAKPTTRLSLMLPELESVGVWRLESHGFNAAAEIPAVAELAQFVGDLVPATLNLVERRAIKDGKTSRFVVPVLDLRIGMQRLRELVAEKSGTAPELTAGGGQERPALAAPKSTPAPTGTAADTAAERLPTVADIAGAKTVEVVYSIYRFLESHNALTDDLAAACQSRKAELEAPVSPEAGQQPDAEGIVDAELVFDGDADAVWNQVLAAGAAKGLDTLDLVSDDFKAQMGGLLPDDATAAELGHYLSLLTGERAA